MNDLNLLVLTTSRRRKFKQATITELERVYEVESVLNDSNFFSASIELTDIDDIDDPSYHNMFSNLDIQELPSRNITDEIFEQFKNDFNIDIQTDILTAKETIKLIFSSKLWSVIVRRIFVYLIFLKAKQIAENIDYDKLNIIIPSDLKVSKSVSDFSTDYISVLKNISYNTIKKALQSVKMNPIYKEVILTLLIKNNFIKFIDFLQQIDVIDIDMIVQDAIFECIHVLSKKGK